MKRVAISQSNYIPWRGYFDMISRVDEFILYDDMQFTRRDWRNRNQIKTAQGLQWLTIPVMSKGNYFEPIKSIRVGNREWADLHWKSIRLNYSRAPHFACFHESIADLYKEAASMDFLSHINRLFLVRICEMLDITTQITYSMDYQVGEGKNERLIGLCQQGGASHYLSGPAARSYVDESAFAAAGISLEWMDYSNYKPYEQRFGEFVSGVSVLDVMFNCGDKAPELVWKHQA